MLLDTHSLIWLLDGGQRFGPVTTAMLTRGDAVVVSSISIAEIRIKEMIGKLTVPEDLVERIVASRVQISAFPAAAADGLVLWPTLARHDPFERLLLAHAVALGLPLVSADRVLLDLPGAPVLDPLR